MLLFVVGWLLVFVWIVRVVLVLYIFEFIVSWVYFCLYVFVLLWVLGLIIFDCKT